MDVDRLTPAERREALQAYLDGELPADDARRVAAWLAVHPEGRTLVESLRRLNDLLGAYEDEPVPEGFAARVLDAVGAGGAEARLVPSRGESAARLRFRRWAPLAAAATVLLGTGVGAFLVLRDRQTPPPEAPPAQETALLETVPPDLLEHADVLLSLSDAEFDAVLALDPDDVADPTNGG